MDKSITTALVVAFALIGVLIAFNLMGYTGMVIKEDWACSQYACDKMITAQEWINTNCYTLPDGSNQAVCKVVIDNKEQLVPLSQINQQALNQCVEVRCVQEARVRPADYKVELPKTQETPEEQPKE